METKKAKREINKLFKANDVAISNLTAGKNKKVFKRALDIVSLTDSLTDRSEILNILDKLKDQLTGKCLFISSFKDSYGIDHSSNSVAELIAKKIDRLSGGGKSKSENGKFAPVFNGWSNGKVGAARAGYTKNLNYQAGKK